MKNEELEEALTEERLTESSKYWAKLAKELMEEAGDLKGTARINMIKEARGCMRMALELDKSEEAAKIAEMAKRMEQQAEDSDRLSKLM